MTGILSRLFNYFSNRLYRVGIGFLMAAVTLIYTWVCQVTGTLRIGQGLLIVKSVIVLFTIAGFLFGPIALTGSAFGYLLYYTTQGTFPVWMGVEYLIYGFLIHLFTTRSAFLDVPTSIHSVRNIQAFLLIVSTAALGSASVFNWIGAVTGQFPYFPGVWISGLSRTLSGLIGGITVLGVLPRLLGNQRWERLTKRVRPNLQKWRVPNKEWIIVSTGLITIWLVLGSAASIGFQMFELIPYRQVGIRSELLLLFTEVGPFSHAWEGIQLGIGTSIIFLWVISLYRYNIFRNTVTDR